MQATIIRVPHVRDSLIVANVGKVTNRINPVVLTNSIEAATSLRETR